MSDLATVGFLSGSPLPWRARLVCVGVILIASLYIAASAIHAFSFAFDDEAIRAEFLRWRHIEAHDLAPWQHLALFAANLLGWGTRAAALGYAIRLFYGFLHGDIFTLSAARRLLDAGSLSLMHPSLSWVRQTLVCAIVTANEPLARHWYPPIIAADQTYNLAVGLLIVALAHVFKAAVQMADEAATIL